MGSGTEKQASVAYPTQYVTQVLLKDGSTIILRPIMVEDVERWMAFVSRLSGRTKFLRFHYIPKEMGREDALRFCTVDYNNTFVFVAEVLREPERDIVAIGRYYRLPGRRAAEVAFAIEDAYQGRGLGTRLLEHLANVAREKGITTFEADVLSENRQMMDVFGDYGFHVVSEIGAGVYHVTFPITRTLKVARKEEERERIATLASLRALLRPLSVALVGASRHPGTIGYLLLQCLTQSGFSGSIFPVNPNADSIMGLKTYRSVLDIPGNVDMAVIAVPAKVVAKVADECGHKGVRSLVIISDGFKEAGAEGVSRENQLRDIAFGHGMRIVGPNCMGVINTDRSVQINATFSPVYPPAGNVAFLSQSGAMGLTILEYASNLNLGISTFVSVGNEADISSNDFLEYWGQDGATKVVLLYLESFVNARKFARLARSVSANKPIVVVKSGTTPIGARAASSHTGAIATSEVASDALFRHAGVIRVNIMEELFDVATLLSNQPLPRGRNLVIVTNGGGPGIIAADAAARNGLLLPQLSEGLADRLRSVVERDIRIDNPLDTTAGATAEEFHEILRLLGDSGDCDAVLAIFVPPIVVDITAMEKTIRSVAPVFWKRGKPLLACFLGERGFKAKLGSSNRFVPCYPFPEEAVAALARAVEYAEIRRKPKGKIPRLTGIKRAKGRKIINRILTGSSERPLWLSPKEIGALLDCYGIPFVTTLFARTSAQAVKQASMIGFPVAMKLASSTILHKSDVGGVVLDLSSEDEVSRAFDDIRDNLSRIGRRQEMDGVVIQRMVKDGIEAIAGVTQDRLFGPLVLFGFGGIYAELVNDVAVRLHPITDLDAKEIISSIKMARLFQGFRGSAPSDTESLENLLLRLSAMVEDIPEIEELDFNPVKVMPRGHGCWVLDSRIMVK